MRYEFKPKMVKATLQKDYKRKKADRLKFIPAHLNEEIHVSPVEFHGSAHINALINSNSMILIPIGIFEINKGETVDVRFL